MTIIYVTDNEVSTASATGGDTEDSLFPASNLGSGDPAEMFRFNAAGLNDFRYVDLGSAKNLNFASVHFHNIDTGVTAIKIQSDTVSNFASPTARATMTKRDPAFFAIWSGGVAERYWRILFEGTNGSAIYVGEWWLGTYTSFTDNQLFGWQVVHQMNQQRTGRFPARANAINLSEDTSPTRQLNMSFIPTTAALRDEGLTFWNATEWGQAPAALVPDSTDSIVLHGSVANDWSWSVDEAGIFPYTLVFDEDPGPVIVK